jgi:hypothetical protein
VDRAAAIRDSAADRGDIPARGRRDLNLGLRPRQRSVASGRRSFVARESVDQDGWMEYVPASIKVIRHVRSAVDRLGSDCAAHGIAAMLIGSPDRGISHVALRDMRWIPYVTTRDVILGLIEHASNPAKS